MPKISDKPFPRMRRIAQISNYHCGPAVLQMLLTHLGEEVTQQELVRASSSEIKLKEFGMNIFEMNKSVSVLAPEYKFWYRDHGTSEELRYLVNDKKHPVGVEWQGLFYEYSDGDDGHYSVVVGIDIDEDKIIIADPYEPFSNDDRVINLHEFLERWWDVNETVNPATNEVTHDADDQMMFLITHKSETFPIELGMKSD